MRKSTDEEFDMALVVIVVVCLLIAGTVEALYELVRKEPDDA